MAETGPVAGQASPSGNGEELASPPSSGGRSPRSYALLSISAAVVTIGLKFIGYRLTGSVGLLSDAIESIINLVAAVVAFWALSLVARPPDAEHSYGHYKAEYFSSGIESALILIAAAGIAYTAWGKLFNPQPLENVGLGLLFTATATAINGGVAFVLLRAGKRLRSITLRADGNHLLTDVWTSIGVVIGVALVQLTGILRLDPIIALLVAANIVWMGIRLLRDSAYGLLDTALPSPDQEVIGRVLAVYTNEGIRFHALRTRMAGPRRFVSFHVLVPAEWTIQRGHDLCEKIELDLIESLPQSTIFTHLEPLGDPVSMQDQTLDHFFARSGFDREP